jgi:hypothetical protein
MASPRADHTATLLPDGAVLIVGGSDTPEQYDPASGRFRPADGQIMAHYEHAAALLPDGRVLVAGGAVKPGGPFTAATELYNPLTRRWSAAAAMQATHWAPTATLLPNGTVLVAGGDGTVRFAEVYDPAADTWTATGPMIIPDRRESVAVLLPDGAVLLLGGGYAVDSIDRPERYDPATNTWRAAAAPRMAYEQAIAPLAGGRVLVAGGDLNTPVPPQAADAEAYDPATNRWAPVGPMPAGADVTRGTPTAAPPVARTLATATLLRDGSVLVAGGFPCAQECGGITNAAEIYAP